MNWRIVVPLGLTGALPPVLTLWMGGSPVVAAVAWTVLALAVWVPAILWARDARPFASLVVVGLVAGVAAGAVETATTGDPMLFVMAILIGVVWGALFGGVALGVRKLRPAA